MKIDRDESSTTNRLLVLLIAAVLAVPLAVVAVPAAAAALIGTDDIENGAVTSAKIATGAVQVKNVRKPVVHQVGAPGQAPYNVGGGFKAYNGPPFGNLSYYKDATGIVHLTGLACEADGSVCSQSTLIGGTRPVFTLPKGFRPKAQQVFTTLTVGQSAYYHARIDVTTAGVVEVVAPPSAGQDWVSFDGISFLAG